MNSTTLLENPETDAAAKAPHFVPVPADQAQPLTEDFPKVKFPKVGDFRSTLEARVEDYFTKTGKSRKGGAYAIFKALTIFTWFGFSYYALVFLCQTWWQVALCCVSVALAFCAIGFNVLHDGGHGSFSKYPLVNKLAAWSFDFIGGSSYIWNVKHNVIHHTFTNVVGADDDIELTPFFHLGHGQPRQPHHAYQHLYFPFLYTLMAPKWHAWEDFRMLFLGKVTRYPLAQPGALEWTVLLSGKVASTFLAFVIPLYYHPWYYWLPAYALTLGLVSHTLALVFQMAHAVDKAETLPPPASGKTEHGFFEHQLATTVNFAPQDPLLTWYVGGLNYQVEHHLFPKISHRHYPEIAKIVADECQKRGITYRSHETFAEGLVSHYRFLKANGQGTWKGAIPLPVIPAHVSTAAAA